LGCEEMMLSYGKWMWKQKRADWIS
jgi:hypothetical protein